MKIFYTTPSKANKPVFVSNTAESVTLKWNPVGKANLYSVYVSSEKDGTYKRVAQIKGTQYTYIKKTPNTAYFFRIAAVIKNSEQSVLGEKSEALKASVGNLKITVPEKIRKGEYPEIKVPGYDDKVSWYSTNRDVIRYRNDRLYAVGSGETTLTAVYKKGKASVKVTVLPSPVSCMASVFDVTNDKYIFERDINAKAYPASITKLITALVTLEHMSVDDIIVVGNELNMVEPLSSRCNIQRGEKFRLGDILYGLLLPSGGDAAYTIAVNCARKVSGKPNMGYVDAKNYFVKMMNEYVKSIGGTGTHCVNPHGYPVDNHYSSVHDLVLIGRKVLENPTLKKITSTSYRYVTSLTGQGHSWSTTNSLIINGAYYYSPYAHGMKTGTVDDYYTGIMSAATKDGRTIITVAIGCKSYNARYNATHALYDAYLLNCIKKDSELQSPFCVLFFITGDDFTNVNSVVITVFVVVIYGFINKTVWLHILEGYLSAYKSKFSFFKGDGAVDKKRCKTCFLCLVIVSSTFCTAEGKRFFIFFTVKAYCEKVIFLNKFIGVSLGADEYKAHILVPELANTTPACCHGVVAFFVTGCNK